MLRLLTNEYFRLGITIVVLSVGLFSIFNGCSGPQTGEVIGHDHGDVEEVTIFVPMAGNPGIMLPMTHLEAAYWKLQLRNGEEEGWVYVDEEEYRLYPLGSWYGAREDTTR